MIIRIKNLRCQTIVGIGQRERKQKQPVIVNVEIHFDGAKAAQTDRLEDTVDYGEIEQRIIAGVEASSFHLLEKLVSYILQVVMEDERVTGATIEVDKPQALSQAEAVSVICSAESKP